MHIDVHAHLMPQRALDIMGRDPSLYNVSMKEVQPVGHCLSFDPGPTIRPFPGGLIGDDMRWEYMEKAGVDHEILSVWADCLGYSLEGEKGARWSRLLNETTAEIVQQHPEKLSLMATVPLQDGELAAQELEYGVRQCGAIGCVIAANINGGNLHSPDLNPFWEAATELETPIFIHPTQPIPLPRTSEFNLAVICQYTYDSTVTVGCLLAGGVMDHYPKLDFILSHGGGYYPFQVGRFDKVFGSYPNRSEYPTGAPSSYLRRFHYDTILHAPEPLVYLKSLVGVDRLLMGTDFPFPVQDLIPLEIYQQAGFTDEEVQAVCYDNVVRLFKKKESWG